MELKNIVRKVIEEQKLPGAYFSDYDFRHVGERVEELILTYDFKPTGKMISNDLKVAKNRFREGSEYADFTPKVAIIYKYIYGWTAGYKVFMTTDENTRYLDRPFFDEPTGKYGKARKVIQLNNTLKEEKPQQRGKVKSEKETLKMLQDLLGTDTVWLLKRNAYGDRRKYAFGFLIDEIAKRYGAVDKALPGYRHQFDRDITNLLEEELEKKGFKVVNIHVGSWVHGWIHRVVYFPA